MALERVVSENALLRKANNEFQELTQLRRERKNRKRIAIKGKFVFNTQEVLNIVSRCKAKAETKTTKKRVPEAKEVHRKIGGGR